MAAEPKGGGAYGAWLLLASMLGGLVVAAVDAFNAGNGIAYSFGAYLVLAATALLLAAGLLVSFVKGMPGWLSIVISFLILIGILGTGLAAYFLAAWVLVAFMVLGLVAWLAHVFADPAARRPTHHTHREAVTS